MKEATPTFEIVTSGQNFIFQVDKEEKEKVKDLEAWVVSIQRVCDELVLSSIGGNGKNDESDDDNILSKSYSMVNIFFVSLSSFSFLLFFIYFLRFSLVIIKI